MLLSFVTSISSSSLNQHLIIRHTNGLVCLLVLCTFSDLIFLGTHGADNGMKTADIVNHHLEKGKLLLARGQLTDALSHFHSAIDADPKHYLAYFRRATAYLAIGRPRSALVDLSKVVELKPDFIAARIQRGNVLLKQGDFNGARKDFHSILRIDASNNEVQHQLDLASQLSQQAQHAEYAYKRKDYQRAIEMFSIVIEHCPWAPRLRELRADSYLSSGDIIKAIDDLKVTPKLIPDNTQAYLRISQLLYSIGDIDDSLSNIRECLKLDPDHGECHDHYVKAKKIAKQFELIHDAMRQADWNECRERTRQVFKFSSDPLSTMFVYRAHSFLCTCMARGQFSASETIKICTQLLNKYSVSDAEILISRAEAHVLNEDYDAALADYQHAHELEDTERVREGIRRVQKLIKQSRKRDYYKILGVRRTANKAEILRAYRKLAVKWHPDKYEGEDKKTAEKTFIDIAAAKEVLTDTEKRAKFDAGVDPLDAQEQAQQHNPFHDFHSFDTGNGQGFTFRFHFN